ncbi:hypothetical protein E3O53_00775 [Cryobacterium sp. TMT2-18-3]|uniref:hypothetical protein n=1 Tax=unclassified Cryobacterium TaxID=2649013 RepID=UPI00106A8055|nr:MULTISPECIES: hypothetical protein [unclassified Cryobacterium]TFC30540.1 hypothetical protein E3O22_03975 [Cryobacterium sp. TMT2-18-2]TFC68242.1 hypothetical protein E3O53_00775 [Cryobacterium sp. TMT2-18-3]
MTAHAPVRPADQYPCAIGIWLRLHGNSGTARIERVVALGAAAPTLLALIWSVRQTTDAPAPVDGIAVATAASLVCALGLVLDTVGARDTAANAQGRTDRLALEAGAGLILVPGTLLTLAAGSPFAGMLLVLAVLIRRFGRTPRAAAASPAAALLTLAGLLVAIVPLALASGSWPPASCS